MPKEFQLTEDNESCADYKVHSWELKEAEGRYPSSKTFPTNQPVHKRSGTTDTYRLQPPKRRELLTEEQDSAQLWVLTAGIQK